jgi:hypothetical protein
MKVIKPSALIKRGWTRGYNLAWNSREERCDPLDEQARYWSIPGAVMRARLPGSCGPEILRRMLSCTKVGLLSNWEVEADKGEAVELLQMVEGEVFKGYRAGAFKGFVVPGPLSPASPPVSPTAPPAPKSGGPTPRESDLAV